MSDTATEPTVPTTDVAIREYVKVVAPSAVLPERWRGKVRDIYACIKAGEELGLPPMVSLRWLFLVNGRFGMAAEGMNALVRQKGHSISGESGPAKAVAHGKRSDTGDEMTVTWTIEMAKRAGLADGVSWQKYPEAMLWSRAVSQLCRMLFPDVLGGADYDEGEIQEAEAGLPFVEITDTEEVLNDGDGQSKPEEVAVTDPELSEDGQSVFESMASETVKRGRRHNPETGDA